ncbi:TPA: deoxyribonuclease IV [Candidatus Geothermarchaeota archaeon]|nr:deoxyribonuclease IV [Candidatus Geothermarchaeota archaeon]HIQ13717.1 deoxyribonuclease IV [Thermoprotei archaeon]
MLRVGVHTSISGGVDKSVDRAYHLGCTAFQIFTRNPRGWKMAPLREEEKALYRSKVERYGFNGFNVAHMPYLPNLSSPKDDIYEKSLNTFINELIRCEELGIPYLVIHLGSHMGSGFDRGKKRLVDAIYKAVEEVDNNVRILLENMAGQKNNMGSRFEDLKTLYNELSGLEDRIGFCFDTAHAFSAGYDLKIKSGVKTTVEEFDSLVGWDNVFVIHLNDSKHEVGSGRDHHEHIGMGYIGEKGFKYLLEYPFIKDKPLILETPVDERRGDVGNIAMVWLLAGEDPPSNLIERWLKTASEDGIDIKIIKSFL